MTDYTAVVRDLGPCKHVSSGEGHALAKLTVLSATVPGVKPHPDKTKAFAVEDGRVRQLPIGQGANTSRPATRIDYLGFTFDGRQVRMRQRTVGRYYRRVYHRIRQMYAYGRPSKRRVEGLYVDFSKWGSSPLRNRRVRELLGKTNSHSNFIMYAQRAQRAFPDDDVLSDVRRHKRKMRKRSNRMLDDRLPSED
jgi:hypothetical protein